MMIELIDKYWVVSGLTMWVVTGLWSLLAIPAVKSSLWKRINYLFKKNTGSYDIMDNYIRYKIDDWLTFRLDGAKFHGYIHGRDLMARDFMKIKLLKFKEIIWSYCESRVWEEKTPQELSVEFIWELKKWRNMYDQEALSQWVSDHFIDLYNKDRMEYCTQRFKEISDIFTKNVTWDNEKSLNDVLIFFFSIFETGILYSSHLVEKLNWSLTWQYRWHILDDKDHNDH